jgi:hypothetical protein
LDFGMPRRNSTVGSTPRAVQASLTGLGDTHTKPMTARVGSFLCTRWAFQDKAPALCRHFEPLPVCWK